MKRFRNKFSEHMNDCDCLKKLKKKDFDSYISEKPMYGESDKIKFRYAASGKKTTRKLVPQLVTAGVILAGFIFLIQTTMDPTSTNTDPNAGTVKQEDTVSIGKDSESEEPKELITDIDDLSFDLELPNYNDRMSIEQLKAILANYEMKQSMLENAKDQMDKQLFAKHKSIIVNERKELLELISQKSREAYEWTIYNSGEALQQHFYDIVPGLKRADELGFVEEVNKTIELDSKEHDFRIERIWYNSNGFYVFYSFNVNNIPEGPLANSFRLRHYEYSLREDRRGSEDVIYNGRVYNFVKYMPLDKNGSDLKNVKGQYTFDIYLRFEDESFVIENQQIPLNYSEDKLDDYAFKVPVNKNIKEQGIELNIDHLEHRLGVNYLNIIHKGHDIYGLHTEVNGEELFASNDSPDKGIFKYPIRASDELPDRLDIKLKSFRVIKDEDLTFEVDTSQIKYGETLEMDEYIGEVYGTKFYIDQLYFFKEGLEVKIRTDSTNEKVNLNLYLPFTMPGLGDYLRPYNQLKIINEQGEEPDYTELHSSINQEGKSFSFSIPANGDTFTISLSKLLFQVDMDEELTIDIKE